MNAPTSPRPAASDDVVIPFSIVGSGVRGRIVRLGALITHIIARHDYPASVGRLIGESVALTALLGSGLKFEGRFILQARTDGPVDLLVAEFATPGRIRAYAHFDTARLGAAAAPAEPALLGAGNLAMTVDQGPHTERYQGIVPLDGGALADAAHVYFRQSEQIPTRLHLGAGELAVPPFGGEAQSWRAGGIMIQHLPGEGGRGTAADADGWDRARHLLDTVSPDELLDPMLAPERLLYRLYHEDGVRAAPARPLADSCHCSRERVEILLASFPPGEIAEMVEDGRIRVTCEFCGTLYEFSPEGFLGGAGAG
jgi:molecular chaperone Hsp33